MPRVQSEGGKCNDHGALEILRAVRIHEELWVRGDKLTALCVKCEIRFF